MKTAGFNRLARVYRGLEYVAFGRDLERARFAFVSELSGCRRVLIFGEGDGRFLARAVSAAPLAEFDCVDASAGMIDAARRRLPSAAAARVRFHTADALQFAPPAAPYDAVVTLFFLDCFTAAESGALISRIARAAAPQALWLFADFCLPDRGWRRWRGRLWLTLLYTFFRLETGISASRLPPAEAQITAAGFHPQRDLTLQHGLIRSVLLSAATAAPAASPAPATRPG